MTPSHSYIPPNFGWRITCLLTAIMATTSILASVVLLLKHAHAYRRQETEEQQQEPQHESQDEPQHEQKQQPHKSSPSIPWQWSVRILLLAPILSTTSVVATFIPAGMPYALALRMMYSGVALNTFALMLRMEEETTDEPHMHTTSFSLACCENLTDAKAYKYIILNGLVGLPCTALLIAVLTACQTPLIWEIVLENTMGLLLVCSIVYYIFAIRSRRKGKLTPLLCILSICTVGVAIQSGILHAMYPLQPWIAEAAVVFESSICSGVMCLIFQPPVSATTPTSVLSQKQTLQLGCAGICTALNPCQVGTDALACYNHYASTMHPPPPRRRTASSLRVPYGNIDETLLQRPYGNVNAIEEADL
jgi:hypothetical protein